MVRTAAIPAWMNGLYVVAPRSLVSLREEGMKERHWNSLVSSIQHGQTVLVLGSEVPAEVAATSDASASLEVQADALRRWLAAELEEDGRVSPAGSLAAVAQQYQDAMGFGAAALRAHVQRFYKASAYRPSEAHRALGRLPFPLILSTCHDDLLVTALRDEGKHPTSHCYHVRGERPDNSEFVLPQSPNAPVIYHLFGHASTPASLTVSDDDLLDFLIAIASDRPPLPNSLVRALKRTGQSFLFVGFGIKQWYLRVLLKVLVRALELHRTGNAIAAEPLHGLSVLDREQTVLFYGRGTRVEVADADVTEFLRELARRVSADGGYLGKPDVLGEQPRVFISYASEDGALAARVFDVLQKSAFRPWMDHTSLRGGDAWDRRIEDELDHAHFALVLHTAAFSRKMDSYVNKEIALARRRSLRVRGSFLIPLQTDELTSSDRVPDLADYQYMPLRRESFDEDMSKVISTMRRDFQRRVR